MGKTHAVSGSRGCTSIGKPMSPTLRGMFAMAVSPVDPQRMIVNCDMSAAYVTRDGGRSWRRLDGGLPRGQAWLTVKRQAMALDAHEPVGVYFGTTSGEVWASRDEGGRWKCISSHLPEIYAVEAAEL